MPSDDFLTAAKSIKLADFKEIHKMPCVAPAITNATVAGLSVGGLQLFLRAPPMKASSWAVGVFAGVSAVIWEACRYKRLQERQHIKEAVIKVEATRRARKEE